jgi:hypothetical protein
VNVWNNAAADGSFGVTSAVELMEVEPHTGFVFHRLAVPPSEVATSFSSKSELALHITKDCDGAHLVFVGYAGAGGALDVSNADTVCRAGPDEPRHLCVRFEVRVRAHDRIREREGTPPLGP